MGSSKHVFGIVLAGTASWAATAGCARVTDAVSVTCNCSPPWLGEQSIPPSTQVGLCGQPSQCFQKCRDVGWSSGSGFVGGNACTGGPPSQAPQQQATLFGQRRVLVDGASRVTGSFGGVSAPSLPVTGVVVLRQGCGFDPDGGCPGGVKTTIDKIELGLGDFTFNGQSIRNAHVRNNGTFVGSTQGTNFVVPRWQSSVVVDALMDNVSRINTLFAGQDLRGSFDPTSGFLTIAGNSFDSTGAVTFDLRGVAQPVGTDTDGDGVPDVNDNCPLVANATQVRVQAPGIVAPPPVTLTSCSNALALGRPAVTDVCGAPPIAVTNDAPDVFPLGTTVVTWTASDSSGNARSATQVVTVVGGDDPSCCPAGTNVVRGTSNNDVLVGTAGPDCLLGFGGQDRITGAGGDDVILGGDGDDILSGDAGNDVISGGTGQDQVTGGDGNDSLSGGGGDDVCRGGPGNDSLLGDQGQDQLFGEDGDDRLSGADGDDRLEGGLGNDSMDGGPNNDLCVGGGGTETFVSCETRR